MEDAHAAILDLQALEGEEELKPAASDVRITFFGVYDGHGGDKVALYAGDHLHNIVAKQESFKNKDFEQALKDGFLAIDRAILSGEFDEEEEMSIFFMKKQALTNADIQTPSTRKKFLDAQLRSASSHMRRSLSYVHEVLRCIRREDTDNSRATPATQDRYSASRAERSLCHSITSHRTKARRHVSAQQVDLSTSAVSMATSR